jgi:hypothetical protein
VRERAEASVHHFKAQAGSLGVASYEARFKPVTWATRPCWPRATATSPSSTRPPNERVTTQWPQMPHEGLLKDPQQHGRLGACLPKDLLLVGPAITRGEFATSLLVADYGRTLRRLRAFRAAANCRRS